MRLTKFPRINSIKKSSKENQILIIAIQKNSSVISSDCNVSEHTKFSQHNENQH